MPGLAIPEDESRDAGLNVNVGRNAACGVACAGQLARELHPGEECLPGGIDGLRVLLPPAELLVYILGVLAEHQGSSVAAESRGRLPILTDSAACMPDKLIESGVSRGIIFATSGRDGRS